MISYVVHFLLNSVTKGGNFCLNVPYPKITFMFMFLAHQILQHNIEGKFSFNIRLWVALASSGAPEGHLKLT